MNSPLGYTEPQAARILDIHASTLRRWRKNGAIGFVLTPGGRIRYRHEDLHQLMQAMKVDPTLGKKSVR